MPKQSSVQLTSLEGRVGDIVYQLTRLRHYSARKWQPAMNAYRCSNQLVICFDLAGVDPNSIDLEVRKAQLYVSGNRVAPEPCGEDKAEQIMCMEIDYGPFERDLALPQDVLTDQARAEQQNGFLWVYLPVRCQA